jgi:hypothetical protein
VLRVNGDRIESFGFFGKSGRGLYSGQMRTPRKHGFFASLLKLLLLGVAAVYGVAAITAPWSFHIGGLWTPLLHWSGAGELHTKGGTYPLYVSILPSSSFSQLRLDGLRPTGGVRGSGALCTARGVVQRLDLSGTIYNGWSSTEGSLMSLRLLEQKIFNVSQRQGFFDLYGRWQGRELVMDSRGEPGSAFPSGLKIEHASVDLKPNSYADFESRCAGTATLPQ